MAVQSRVGSGGCLRSLPGSVAGDDAAALLVRARRALAESEAERDPARRFAAGYLAAQRAAAAVLVASGRPHRGRHKPASVWELVGTAVPELGEWSGYFAARSGLYAAAQAGHTSRVGGADAEQLFEQARRFVSRASRVTAAEAVEGGVA